MSVLASRPEPKIIKINKINMDKYTGSVLHSMHNAGGYEHLNYTRRNWVDIIQDITLQTKNVTVGDNNSNSNSNNDNDNDNSNDNCNNNSNSNSTSINSTLTASGSGSGSGSRSNTVWPWPLLWE